MSEWFMSNHTIDRESVFPSLRENISALVMERAQARIKVLNQKQIIVVCSQI